MGCSWVSGPRSEAFKRCVCFIVSVGSGSECDARGSSGSDISISSGSLTQPAEQKEVRAGSGGALEEDFGSGIHV